jgi:ribosomal protein S1
MATATAKETEDLTMFQDLLEKSPTIQYPKMAEVINGEIIKIEKKNILVNVNNQFT